MKKKTWETVVENRIAQQQFYDSLYKMCPKCGSLIPLSAIGCDNCLTEFNKKEVKEVGRDSVRGQRESSL